MKVGEDRLGTARKPREAPLSSYMGHTSCVRSLAMSPDGTMFASGAADSSVRLWALEPDGLRSAAMRWFQGGKREADA